MATICRFLGITIRMYYDEHAPPHFHALYGDDDAVIEIETLALTRGRLPKRVTALVVEWAFQHREELRENWRRVETQEPFALIAPLE